MKILTTVWLAVLVLAPVVSTAQDVDARADFRSLPSESSASLVLTPQGAERLARSERVEGPLSLPSELETPRWSRAQSLGLLWATTIACSATRLGCVATPPAQAQIPPPGSESWREVGCKKDETCRWFRRPVIEGQYPSPQQ